MFGSGPPMNASKLSLIYKNYILIPILTLRQLHTTDLPSSVSYSFPWSCSRKQSCLFHALCSAWEQHAVFCSIRKPLCPSLSSPPHLASLSTEQQRSSVQWCCYVMCWATPTKNQVQNGLKRFPIS